MPLASSSAIRRYRYNKDRRELHVVFTTGRHYRYFRVPTAIYAGLDAAASKGTYFNAEIRDRFDFEELPQELAVAPAAFCHDGTFMTLIRDNAAPLTIVFADDGLVPNNRLPFVVYKNAIDVDQAEPEAAIERVFGGNGWGQMWRNGIFDYLHYHATVHEALGVARGAAKVQFGGDGGRAFDLVAGDVAILPAGTGHQRLSASADFSVVGAYPPGPQMEITRPTPENHAKALTTIPQVAPPQSDPVFGADGPLIALWRKR